MRDVCGKESSEQASNSCLGCCFRNRSGSLPCFVPISVTKCEGTVFTRTILRDVFQL